MFLYGNTQGRFRTEEEFFGILKSLAKISPVPLDFSDLENKIAVRENLIQSCYHKIPIENSTLNMYNTIIFF